MGDDGKRKYGLFAVTYVWFLVCFAFFTVNLIHYLLFILLYEKIKCSFLQTFFKKSKMDIYKCPNSIFKKESLQKKS